MNRRDVEAFVHRDWAAVQDSKSAYWADQFRRHGWGAAWRAADALWVDVRLAQPEYPSAADRERDLAHHLTLRARLDRAASAFTSR
ncbi:MAG: hypothetical protein H0X44_05830 [Acidobacteria bacterium]|nr:hypothetical protein [Acidobacteriota bacterium]